MITAQDEEDDEVLTVLVSMMAFACNFVDGAPSFDRPQTHLVKEPVQFAKVDGEHTSMATNLRPKARSSGDVAATHLRLVGPAGDRGAGR